VQRTIRDTDQQPQKVIKERSHYERHPADTAQAYEAEREIEYRASYGRE